MKEYEKLTLADNFMFGKVMRNPILAKRVVEMLLRVEILRIEYLEYEKTLQIRWDAKGVRLDLYIQDEKRTVYNIELQIINLENLIPRSRYYQSIIDLDMIEKGGDYLDLKVCYVIFLCPFDLFGEDRYIYTFEYRCQENYEIRLNDGTCRVFVNFNGRNGDINEDLKNFFNYLAEEKVSDEFTKELKNEVEKARSNQEWRCEYMTMIANYADKYREGMERGIEKGIGIGSFNVLIKLVRNGTITLEEAAKLNNMSVEEFKDGMERNLLELK